MAGLDFLTSDDAQLGLALLAAAGPQATPMSFGQRLAGGMQQAAQTRSAREDRAFKQQLMQSQIAENQAQAKFREQEAALAAKKQANIDAWLNGGGPAPAATGGLLTGSEPSGGLMAAPVPAPGGPAPGGGGGGGFLSRLSPETLARGAVLGVPGITGVAKAWELANPEMKESNGYFYNPRAVAPGMNQEMRAAALQDARDKADIAAGRQRIKYRAEDGSIREGWADEVDPRQQGRAAAPAPPARPLIATPGGGYRNEGQMKGTAALSDDPVAAAQRELASIQREAPNAPDQKSRAAMAQRAGELKQVIATGAAGVQTETPAAYRDLLTPSRASGPGITLEATPAQQAEDAANKAAAVKLAEGRAGAQVARETASATTGRQFQQMTAAAELADKLLDSGPTGSGAGALADRVGNFVGQPLKGASQAAQLKALGGWLVSNVPRMEGPQSDRDVANYAVMAGQVGDETVPPSTRKAALRTMIQLQTKYAAINGGAPAVPSRQFSGAIGEPGSAAPPLPAGWTVKVK